VSSEVTKPAVSMGDGEGEPFCAHEDGYGGEGSSDSGTGRR
jgi:hypothetical protein